MFHSCFNVYAFVKILSTITDTFYRHKFPTNVSVLSAIIFCIAEVFSPYLFHSDFALYYPSKSDLERFIQIFNTKPIAVIFVHIELPP